MEVRACYAVARRERQTRFVAARVARRLGALLTACARRRGAQAARPVVVQGAMDVEIRTLAAALQHADRRARRRLDVLARHDRRLSGRRLENAEGHGERGGRHRARRRALSPGRRSSIRAPPAATRRTCTSPTSCSARSRSTSARSRPAFARAARGSDHRRMDAARPDAQRGQRRQDPSARTMRRFAGRRGSAGGRAQRPRPLHEAATSSTA